MKNAINNIILIIVSTILAILLCEGILWSMFKMPYHSDLKWQPDGHFRGRHVPNQSFRSGPSHNPLRFLRSETHINQINKYGFRGKNHSIQPEAGVVRIVFLGGSSTFNFHDSEENTWPEKLGHCLTNRLGTKTDVVNLALPGYPLAISKMVYLTMGRLMHPHITVVYHTWNDLKIAGRISIDQDVLIFNPVAQEQSLFYQAGRWLAEYSQITRHLRSLYYRLKRQEREGNPIPEDNWTLNHQAENWFIQNFTDIVNFARSDDVIPILSTQASLLHEYNTRQQKVHKHIPFDLIRLNFNDATDLAIWAQNTIKKVGQQTGSQVVDVYNKMPPTLQYLEDYVHITPEGQTFVADLLCKDMAANFEIRNLYQKIANQ